MYNKLGDCNRQKLQLIQITNQSWVESHTHDLTRKFRFIKIYNILQTAIMIRSILKLQTKILGKSLIKPWYQQSKQFSTLKTISMDLKKAMQQQLQNNQAQKVDFAQTEDMEWKIVPHNQLLQFTTTHNDYNIIAITNVLMNSETSPRKFEFLPGDLQVYVTVFVKKIQNKKWLAIDYRISNVIQIQIQSLSFIDNLQQQRQQLRTGEYRCGNYKGPEYQCISQEFQKEFDAFLNSIGLNLKSLIMIKSISQIHEKSYYREWLQNFVKFF